MTNEDKKPQSDAYRPLDADATPVSLAATDEGHMPGPTPVMTMDEGHMPAPTPLVAKEGHMPGPKPLAAKNGEKGEKNESGAGEGTDPSTSRPAGSHTASDDKG